VWKEGTLFNVMIIIIVTALANKENIVMTELPGPAPGLLVEAVHLNPKVESSMSAISAAHSLKMSFVRDLPGLVKSKVCN